MGWRIPSVISLELLTYCSEGVSLPRIMASCYSNNYNPQYPSLFLAKGTFTPSMVKIKNKNTKNNQKSGGGDPSI